MPDLTDQNDPDGLNWQIARAVQPHIFMDRNNLSELDPAHIRQMAIDRARGMGTWMRAVQIADAVIDALPEAYDCGPHVVNTVEELEALPIAVVVRSVGVDV